MRRGEEDNALTGGEPRTVRRDKLVLALATFERDARNVPLLGELLDGGDDAIVVWLEQRGGRHRMPEIIVKEVTQAAGCLELGHVGVQIDAIDAADFKRDVVADNIRDVGRHQTFLAGSPMKVLQPEHAGRSTGPNIVFPTRPRSGRDPKVRRVTRQPISRPSPHHQWRPGLSRRFEAKLRCQPVVKV